ncbi:MAG: hypothetical protein IJQ71_09690 [Clostridia bacterium]|nr:hypothetical protein [Clostridia bacterium]
MITKKDAQDALNRSLSGLQSNPYIVQKIITGTKEKAYKRKKLSSTAIIAFVLVGIMASAMATGIAINGKPWGVLNWIFEAQPNSTAVTATQKIYPDSEQILQEATASPSETQAIIPMEVVAISTESCEFDFATLSIREAVTDGYGIYLSIAAVPSNPDILLLDWSINPFESSPEIIGQVSDYQNQTLAEWAVNHKYKQLIRLSIGSPLPEPYTHGRLISSEKYDPDPAIADKQTVQSDGWSYDLVSNGSGFDSYINRRMVLEEDGTSLIMIAGGFMNQKEYEIACFMMPWRMTGDGKEDPADYDSPGLDPKEPIYDMDNRERGILSFVFPDNPTVSSTILAEYDGDIPLLSNPEMNGHIHIQFVRTQLNDYCLAEYSDLDRVYEHLLIYENETPGSFISYSKLFVSCYQLNEEAISFLRSCIVPDEFPETIYLQWVDHYENMRQTFTINKQ